jgi:exodeoxyribonuclease V alpha subunit
MQHENALQTQTLSAIVQDVSYRSRESGYTVFTCECADALLPCVGIMPELVPGEALELCGTWVVHSRYGRQFSVQSCTRKMPENGTEVLQYLSSGLIPGVGRATARRIVETFGEDTIAVMENTPQRLAEIRGVSAEKAARIGEEFSKQYALRQVVLQLESLGLTTQECLLIYKHFGAQASEITRGNPYLLCGGDIGLSLARADAIADRVSGTIPIRYRDEALVFATLSAAAAKEGDCCLPRTVLLRKILEDGDFSRETEGNLPPPERYPQVIDALLEEKRVLMVEHKEDALLYLPSLFFDEKSAVNKVTLLYKFPPAPVTADGTEDLDVVFSKMEAQHGVHYSEKQRDAMRTALASGFLLLTGGPGTGKTTVLRGILTLFKKARLRTLLAAPTGRAAKRMADLTGAEAMTIHRLLEVEWLEGQERQTFARNRTNPLACHALIVDECSMIDITLFAALLDALPMGCRLVLVGDANQLPPVGPGAPFQELIAWVEAQKREIPFPVTVLDTVFRQAKESRIVDCAHKILSGGFPALDVKDKDLFFLPRGSVAETADTVTQLILSRLPKAYGFDPLKDIQVLCPSRIGETGTHALGARIRAALHNAPPEEKKSFRYAKGDKVMQVRNNYELEVYNGDIGFVEGVFHTQELYTVRFSEQEEAVQYPFSAQSDLEQAYAITVHKSQGGEFPCVIIPLCGVPQNLCYRNLIYTAVTRAQKLLIFVGSPQVLAAMIGGQNKMSRTTGFTTRLEAALNVGETVLLAE